MWSKWVGALGTPHPERPKVGTSTSRTVFKRRVTVVQLISQLQEGPAYRRSSQSHKLSQICGMRLRVN